MLRAVLRAAVARLRPPLLVAVGVVDRLDDEHDRVEHVLVLVEQQVAKQRLHRFFAFDLAGVDVRLDVGDRSAEPPRLGGRRDQRTRGDHVRQLASFDRLADRAGRDLGAERLQRIDERDDVVVVRRLGEVRALGARERPLSGEALERVLALGRNRVVVDLLSGAGPGGENSMTPINATRRMNESPSAYRRGIVPDRRRRDATLTTRTACPWSRRAGRGRARASSRRRSGRRRGRCPRARCAERARDSVSFTPDCGRAGCTRFVAVVTRTLRPIRSVSTASGIVTGRLPHAACTRARSRSETPASSAAAAALISSDVAFDPEHGRAPTSCARDS